MKKMLSVMLAVILVLAGCSQQSANTKNVQSTSNANSNSPKEVKIMKLSVVVPKDRSLAKGLFKFGEIVEKETGGAIKVQVYTDGQLGGDRDVFEGMQLGTIQGSTMSTAIIASFAPKFNLFDLPFLFANEQQAYSVLDGPIGQQLLDELASTQVVGLNYWENGFRHFTNNIREVKSVDDVKGLKIRTLENQLHIDAWQALGATPTPMAYNELFTALQQKVVDGQENPIGNIKTAKFYEVQKFMTKTGHIYNASPFLISKRFWDTLTDKEKNIVKKAAEEVRDFQRKTNQDEDKEALQFIKDKGMTVTELTPEALQSFKQKLQPIYDKYASTVGKDLLDKVLNTAKK